MLTPFMRATLAVHVAAPVLCLARPAAWPWALGALILNHLAITAAGMLPRCRLLGANLSRLPAAAAQRGEVAITIDDGPDPEVTPQVLALLAARGVSATFFCIGERAQEQPALCRAIVAAGHQVENHGQRHRKHCAFSSPRGWASEVGEGRRTLAALTGHSPRYFRALAGLRNPFLDPVLQDMDVQLVSWTRRGYDSCEGNPDKVLARLLSQLAAGDILLLHDGNGARMANGQAVILDVLPRLLDALAARQLTPVTLEHACNAP